LKKEIEKIIIENLNSKEETLNLSGFYLNEIPHSVFELVHLKELKLMHNQIKVIPKEISRLKNLSHLYLYNNKISEIPLKAIRKLYLLQCIDLAENLVNLKTVKKVYKEIDKNRDYGRFLKKVEELNENSTHFWFQGQINKIPKKLFEYNNLQDLSINSSKLKKIPKEIGKLSNLKSLSFSYNQLRTIPEELFQIESLEEVYFDNNRFLYFPEGLLEMPNLKSISFNTNKITQIRKYLNIAVKNKSIRYFSFGDNPLKDFNSNLFTGGYDYIKENVYGINSHS
jgi:internalin A